MKTGAVHLEFALLFRKFLAKKDFRSPNEFHRDLVRYMGPYAPSNSTVWAAFYGTRLLPAEAIFFMAERYGFEVRWKELLPVRNMEGALMKKTDLELPGMREVKEAFEARRGTR